MGILDIFWGASPKLSAQELENKTVYDYTVETIDGQEKSLGDYAGQVMVIVNVASKCGLTPQYESLEKYYEENKDKGVVILGFPANNFLKQEPGTNDEIQNFCKKNYGVSFPMFAKISVKGKDQAPLYQYLTSAMKDTVKWNFQKYIINKNGEVVASIPPKQTIDDPKTQAIIEAELAK